jgi:hypothetical protein
MANVNAENCVEKYQYAKLKLELGEAYGYKVGAMVYDV